MVSTVDGLISGLSTSSMIDQLMQVEAAGQTQLKTRISTQQQSVASRLAVNSAVSALVTASRSLTSSATWSATKATSSSPSVTATALPSAAAGELVFDVERTATAHTLVAGASVSGLASVVASGPLTLTRADGTTASIPVGDGSLAAVVSAINASGSGVRATTVQVSTGEYRLQLRAATTGAASSFSMAGLGASLDMGVGTAGQDARIVVDPGSARSLTVSSASNTFRDVVPGLTFTVTGPATGASVRTEPDVPALADKVSAMVDAANKALDTIKSATAYDASSKKGGPLLGDSAVRSFQQALLGAFSGGASSSQKAGVTLGRDGRISFDKAAFTSAFAADPAGTQALLGRATSVTGSAGGDVQVVGSTDATKAGSYAVVVTQAATRASSTVAVGALTSADSVTLSLSGKTVTLAATDGESAADFAARLSTSARTAGLALGVTADGGGLVVQADAYGSGVALGVTTAGGLPSAVATAGKDVVGTVGGHAATGSGQLLTVTAANKPATGLALLVTADAAEVTTLAGAPAGTAVVAAGLAHRLSAVTTAATDPATGGLMTALDAQRSRIDDLQDQVSAWDVRLKLRRTSLERTYASLEVALGAMKSQSSWLGGQLSALSSGS